MKEQYHREIRLICATCGGDEFEYNDDKTYVKCKCCNREYLGGYDELVEYNRENIYQNVDIMVDEVTEDLSVEMTQMFKDAFKGNKYIKFK